MARRRRRRRASTKGRRRAGATLQDRRICAVGKSIKDPRRDYRARRRRPRPSATRQPSTTTAQRCKRPVCTGEGATTKMRPLASDRRRRRSAASPTRRSSVRPPVLPAGVLESALFPAVTPPCHRAEELFKGVDEIVDLLLNNVVQGTINERGNVGPCPPLRGARAGAAMRRRPAASIKPSLGSRRPRRGQA
jgi:hypothetical protein